MITASMMSASMTVHQGPLPPAEVIEKYGAVYQDAPEIIFTYYKKQADHRMDLEQFTVRSDARRSWGGLAAGVLVAFAAIAANIWLAILGHVGYGTTLGGGSIAGLVGVFVYGRSRQGKERLARLNHLERMQRNS